MNNISVYYREQDKEILKYLENILPANISKSEFIMECVRHKVKQMEKQKKLDMNSFFDHQNMVVPNILISKQDYRKEIKNIPPETLKTILENISEKQHLIHEEMLNRFD